MGRIVFHFFSTFFINSINSFPYFSFLYSPIPLMLPNASAKKLPIRARSGDATQVFINDLNLKLQNAGKHSGKTLNCRLNLHQYWLRSRKLHSFTFQTYLKVDHWRRWWFTDHDDINSGEIGFDKNIRFLSLSNKIMEEISHFYINMRITAASLSNWREIACLFILFLILSSK